MQVLQAGPHKFIYLELEADTIAMLAKQAGFDSKAKETDRLIQLDLSAPSREGPLLLFDAMKFSVCVDSFAGPAEIAVAQPVTVFRPLSSFTI